MFLPDNDQARSGRGHLSSSRPHRSHNGETQTGSQPGPSHDRAISPYAPGQVVQGRILIDLEGRLLCNRCGQATCDHVRDNDDSPACDMPASLRTDTSHLYDGIIRPLPAPLIRTGQGDYTRDDADGGGLDPWFILLAAIIGVALTGLILNFF